MHDLRSSLTGIAWPGVPDTARATLLALLWQFDYTECLSPEALVTRQFAQIAQLVEHSAAQSPFWRTRLAEAGIVRGAPLTREAWRRLPVLTRAEAQAAGDALHALPAPRDHGKLTRSATSGSTGAALNVVKTELTQLFWYAFLVREMLWHGWQPGSLAVIREDEQGKAPPPDGYVRPDWGGPVAHMFQTGPGALLDMRCSLETQVDWLVRQKPEIFLTWPSNLAALTHHCRAHDIKFPRLRVVRTVSETVTPTLRALCREAWGVELVDAYSAVEIGYIALQCPGRTHYHVQSEGVLVEVLDEAGEPCKPGEVGRVVLTPLHNFAMPLLRYELGDDAEVGGPCSCGRTLPTLTRIVGRTRDRLIIPGSGRRFAYNPSETFAAIRSIQRYQIAQVALDTLEIRLIARAPLTEMEQRAIDDALAVALGHRFALSFVYREAFPLGAKFRDVVCEISD